MIEKSSSYNAITVSSNHEFIELPSMPLVQDSPDAKAQQEFEKLDNAKLGWFHLRSVLVAGAGFFTDAYDLFVIALVIPMIYQVYYPQPNNPQAGSTFTKDYPVLDGLVKSSTNWGNLVGQLLFGYLGDKLGRKKMYGVELIIIIVATIGSMISAPAKYGFNILSIFAAWRFVLGVGIGGDYPASAVITSEFSNVKNRGMLLASVFAMQGIGILVGGLVTVIVLAAMESFIRADPNALDTAWRVIIGFGLIPAVIAVYFRLTIPETPRYTSKVNKDVDQANRDLELVLDLNEKANVTSSVESKSGPTAGEPAVFVYEPTFWEHFGNWQNGKVLFGAAYCWFALDIAWYGLSLNQTRILNIINYNGSNSGSVFDSFYQKGLGALIIACMGTVPGYWVTVGLVDRIGRKTIQYLGFGVITAILALLSLAFDFFVHHQAGFVILFTIANFFFNFGPNQTTFIIPAEVFPTRFRSTGHGLAAAAGKLGAILGIQLVAPYFDSFPDVVMGVFALVMLTGFFATTLIPETMGKTLEELSGEA